MDGVASNNTLVNEKTIKAVLNMQGLILAIVERYNTSHSSPAEKHEVV